MSRREPDERGVRDAATILPIAAAVLLLPPFILVFTAPATLAGIPLIIVYVFGAWAAIVLAAWLVARRLETPDDADGQPDAEEPPPAGGL